MAIISQTGALSGVVFFQLDFDDVALKMMRYYINNTSKKTTVKFKIKPEEGDFEVEDEFDTEQVVDVTFPEDVLKIMY